MLGPLVREEQAQLPARIELAGSHVVVAPLSAAQHGDSLWNELGGEHRARLWEYLGEGPFTSRQDFENALTRREAATDPVFYSFLDPRSGNALGMAGLMRIDVPNRVIEVGNIMYSEKLQRSRAATEAMYLLAKYAFETLHYRRYEWKCNALNEPSRRAALRLGFTFEGIFRQHMIVKGRNRDTAWFSMLDSEWPARKADLERWLEDSNFDAAGNQRSRLRST